MEPQTSCFPPWWSQVCFLSWRRHSGCKGIHITQWYGDEAQTYCYRPALQVSKINLFIQYLPQGWYKFLCLEGKHIYLFVSRSIVCPQLMLFNRWVGEWRKHLLRQGAVFSAGTSVWYPRKALTLHVHVYWFQQAAWVCFSWNPVLTMPVLVLGRLWWFYLLAKCLA